MTGAPGTEAHRHLVEDLYASFSQAEFAAIRRILSPSVSFQFIGKCEQVVTEVDPCIEFLENLRTRWTDITIVLRELLNTDDMVASNGMILLYASPDGLPTVREFAHEWRFHNMLVVSFVDISPLLTSELSERPHDG